MVTWNNLDTLASYEKLTKTSPVKLAEVMSGDIWPADARRQLGRGVQTQRAERA